MAFAGHVVITAVMAIAALPFLTPLLGIQEQAVSGPIWLLVVISAAANLLVMGYHYTVPPHPKFLLTGWRRLILRLHILSGTVELIAGIVALLNPGHRTAATVMALTALCVHVPSALGQTPIVFGSRAIMRPGYLLCIGLHAFCAARLLAHPSSTYWAVATFLIFNVYVWCRLYYYVFDKFGLFEGSRYTVAICAAGLTTIPAILGASSILLLVTGSAIYMGLYSLFFIRSPLDYREFVRERARDASPVDGYMALVDGQDTEATEAAARRFFETLDDDGDGQVSSNDLHRSLVASGLATEGLLPVLTKQFGDAALSFQSFLEGIWPVKEIRHHALVVAGAAAAKSERDKAEFVFRLLDLDHNGYLDRSEFETLTAEWAMPEPEASRLLDHLGLHGDGRIDFDHFFRKLRPIWRFIYYDVVDAKHGRQEDMLVRAVTAYREARATQAVRHDLRRELVTHIDFLQGATEDFLDELAASLVEVSHPAGSTLFAEGDDGDCLYIVRRGRLNVEQGGERLGRIDIGGWLGEGALMDGGIRSATAKTDQDVTLLEMSRASFQFLLNKYPAVAESLRDIHEDRRLEEMRRSLQRGLLAEIPFLHSAGQGPLAALVESLERESTETTIFEEGEPGDRFYLVASGRVRIVHQGRQVAELSTGAYFGEGALLSKGDRTATALPIGPCTLYSLNRQNFDRILSDHPSLAESVKEAHRLRQHELSSLGPQEEA